VIEIVDIHINGVLVPDPVRIQIALNRFKSFSTFSLTILLFAFLTFVVISLFFSYCFDSYV
jgi:hypothetical protein